jgi:hypothetical protein
MSIVILILLITLSIWICTRFLKFVKPLNYIMGIVFGIILFFIVTALLLVILGGH